MRQNGRTNGDQTIDKTDLLTVYEAAEVLGINPEAVRSRLHRGTLERHKAEDGTVYVRLDADRLAQERRPNGDRTGERTAQVEELRDQIAYLREIIVTRDRELEGRAEELSEMRRIVAGMVQANTELARTVRELEAPKVTPTEAAGSSQEDETVLEEPQIPRRPTKALRRTPGARGGSGGSGAKVGSRSYFPSVSVVMPTARRGEMRRRRKKCTPGGFDQTY